MAPSHPMRGAHSATRGLLRQHLPGFRRTLAMDTDGKQSFPQRPAPKSDKAPEARRSSSAPTCRVTTAGSAPVFSAAAEAMATDSERFEQQQRHRTMSAGRSKPRSSAGSRGRESSAQRCEPSDVEDIGDQLDLPSVESEPKFLGRAMRAVGFSQAACALSQQALQPMIDALPAYVRLRQICGQDKTRRAPRKQLSELDALEPTMLAGLRALEPCLFQRFSDLQLARLLRTIDFVRFCDGEWVYGYSLDHPLPFRDLLEGNAVFLVASGRVTLYDEPDGRENYIAVGPGTLFAKGTQHLGSEPLGNKLAGSARAAQASYIAVITPAHLETAFADRFYDNRIMSHKTAQVPVFKNAMEPMVTDTSDVGAQRDSGVTKETMERVFKEFAKVATVLHVQPDHPLLSQTALDDSFILVTGGSLEVRADIHLRERPESTSSRRIRISITVRSASDLDSPSKTFFDRKLNPYCVVQLGIADSTKRIQTPALAEAGPSPKWGYQSMLAYAGESTLEVTVFDFKQYGQDVLIGYGSVALQELSDAGWNGEVPLQRESGPRTGELVPAGSVHLAIDWTLQPLSDMEGWVPRQHTWPSEPLFSIGKGECWGHEQLMLGIPKFLQILERGGEDLVRKYDDSKYTLHLSDFQLISKTAKGPVKPCTCMKVTNQQLLTVMKKCGRMNKFESDCRMSVVKKKRQVVKVAQRLMEAWDRDEIHDVIRAEHMDTTDVPDEPILDPEQFREAYDGTRASIIVRYGQNLPEATWFDKLDPFVMVKFRGSRSEFRTAVLADAGASPYWNGEGTILYSGETELEVFVFDYNKPPKPAELVAAGKLSYLQFYRGMFEGMVLLDLKGRPKSIKKPEVAISLQFGRPARSPPCAVPEQPTEMPSSFDYGKPPAPPHPSMFTASNFSSTAEVSAARGGSGSPARSGPAWTRPTSASRPGAGGSRPPRPTSAAGPRGGGAAERGAAFSAASAQRPRPQEAERPTGAPPPAGAPLASPNRTVSPSGRPRSATEAARSTSHPALAGSRQSGSPKGAAPLPSPARMASASPGGRPRSATEVARSSSQPIPVWSRSGGAPPGVPVPPPAMRITATSAGNRPRSAMEVKRSSSQAITELSR